LANTTFIDGQTTIKASWLNDVNTVVYNPTAAIISASSIINIPAGNIAAINVQLALNELDTKKIATTAIGTTVQAWDAQLNTLSGLTATQAGQLTALSGYMGPALAAADLAALVATLGLVTVPVGTIIDFSGTTAPSGFLACPLVATNISRTTYAALHAVMSASGYPWGAGDGSTTFGMPWFPADYAGVQANANVGTATVGAVISHTHVLTNGQSPSTTVGGYYAYASLGSQDGATSPIAPTGGAANLAAGNRILKCVKI
jgi:hypothetical protein